MHAETDAVPLVTAGRKSDDPEAGERIHPLLKLNHLVRMIACPMMSMIVVSVRWSAGDPMPWGLWLALALYGLVWPHAELFFARRSRQARVAEMRFLLLDCAALGAAVALISFQIVPSLALVTGVATVCGSVGGARLLLVGLAALGSSILLTALITGFGFVPTGSVFITFLSAMLLLVFQTMMGLLTYRTARNFVRSRRRIAEQAEEIQSQNEALVEAREEALQAAHAKAAFLATMSHEIRTPLNGVLGMTRLLADTPLNSEQQDFVRTIQVSGTTLLTVINEILEYSRIESGRLELEEEPFSVRDVVEETLEMVSPRAREIGLELICEIDPGVPDPVVGDVTRLRQILTNLVGNAVKFTERGEVVVSVHRTRYGTGDVPGELEFEIRDTGIGIPEDRITVLFEPFSQADASTTRRYGGTGLGLAISRRLTELMGGTISVRSVAGEGSTFSFTIQARTAAAEADRGERETVSLERKRVLVVDDNGTNRRVLCEQLKRWGMKPASADGAAQALELLTGEDRRFDLGILDLHMPDTDGMMLARLIREQPVYRDVPLILLSSSLVQRKDDPDRLFHSRLLKPIRQSRLFDSVLTALDVNATSSPFDQTEPGVRPIRSSAPLNILVADDNDINRKLAAIVFRRFGYQVDFVVNGREAVDQVVARGSAGDPYDLVFMDVHMPEMDGLEATRMIRRLQQERPEKHWPKIVAMTADAMPEDRGVCLAAGMDDYLTKPLDFAAVRNVLEQAAKTIVLPLEPDLAVPAAEAASETTPGNRKDQPPVVIDWSRLDELRSYDTPDGALVKSAIAAFVEQAPATLLLLRDTAGAGDAQGLRRSAHGLKGAALNIGASAVAEWAVQLEDAGRNSAFDRVPPLMENLSFMLVQTLAELHDRSSAAPEAP
jgi:signal transduction histidine kinase/CheY-like chemotaxis protein/HPt (histidine-containing phosphotransfer) domain-containing protein